MKILDQIITILTPLIPVLLILLGNKLEGFRVKLLSILGFLIGGWTMISTTLLPQMCDQLHLFCNIQSSQTFAAIAMVISFITYVYRQLQGGSANMKDLPSRFTSNWKSEVQALRAKPS